MTGRGIDVADASFQLGGLELNATVLDSWAERCEPERRLAPVFEQPRAFEGMLRFAKLAADANPPTPNDIGARGFMTVHVLRGVQTSAPIAVHVSAVGECLDVEWRLRAA